MAAAGLDRQLSGCKSPHGSLVILAVDLAGFCDNESTRRPSVEAIRQCQVFEIEGTYHFVAPIALHPPPL